MFYENTDKALNLRHDWKHTTFVLVNEQILPPLTRPISIAVNNSNHNIAFIKLSVTHSFR